MRECQLKVINRKSAVGAEYIIKVLTTEFIIYAYLLILKYIKCYSALIDTNEANFQV